jgi:2-polyprenyl-3-methyl-5-hydroxy-6-metoxy-1,4-benzoquinol methylase
LRWKALGISARGSDFSSKVIQIARENAQLLDIDPSIFVPRSIYELTPERDSADLLVCCEVLEHLDKPEIGLMALEKTASKHIVLSVPREPIWRMFNLLRGKYVTSFGNTPGHIQHWTSRNFIESVSHHFNVLAVKKPIPWTMVLCRIRP